MGASRFTLNVHFFRNGVLVDHGRFDVLLDATVLDLYEEIGREVDMAPLKNFTLLTSSGMTLNPLTDGGKSLRREFELSDNEAVICVLNDYSSSKKKESRTKHQKLVDAIDAFDLEGALDLLVQGADPNTKGTNGETLMHIACASGEEAYVKYLYESFGAKLEVYNEVRVSPLFSAVTYGSLSLVLWLAGECNALVHQSSHVAGTTLHEACSHGHLPVAKWLVENHGLNVDDASNQGGVTPLMCASAAGKHLVVEWLAKDCGADLEALSRNGGASALILAVGQNRKQVVEVLIDSGARLESVNSYGQTALITASGLGRWPIVKLLLDRGADPKHRDILGRTASDLACTDSVDKTNKKKIQAVLEASIQWKNSTYKVGDVVVITGLEKKPDYNGLEGTIQSFFPKQAVLQWRSKQVKRKKRR